MTASANADDVSGGPVIVCGAGAAGLAASLAAARAGRRVWLVERGPDIGGTVARALIHTLAGLYDTAGELINDGLPRELVERLLATGPQVRKRRMGKVFVLNVDPSVYRQTVRAMLDAEPRLEILCSTQVTQATRVGNRVGELVLEGPSGAVRVAPRAVVDATGGGAVASLLGDDLLQTDTAVAAGGWIFRMRGVAGETLAFPRSLGLARALHEAAAAGRLPPDCAKAWIDVGVHPDEVFVKLFVPLGLDWRRAEAAGRISTDAREVQRQVVAHLATLPGFERAEVTETGQLGVRDGGRVRGDYLLTRDDVVAQRRFEDAACRCAWPIEYWDRDKGVVLEYLPDGGSYDIPMRSLRVASFENLWAAGKSLSADRYAQASARCAGTCWAMGEAVGRAAAGDRREQQPAGPEPAPGGTSAP